ncbi:hypothetical protein THASP1DRAFT_32174 [Thamnocephalis sphaerospora]|uniref:Uncharacterized protein n=1 Tax=Thamnocephalis sphaerospora TaxID=78915 RepID=A0A4P9XJQ3_9FUNG|nr:hypothetical protein THASP1DRAFT_32174 [Thamnocephalis sphaerospora]|eukprot:RKP06003.1 hypothetical protein THASP1DRAFT_32174 [Thamnocephalis sphaerospora]
MVLALRRMHGLIDRFNYPQRMSFMQALREYVAEDTSRKDQSSTNARRGERNVEFIAFRTEPLSRAALASVVRNDKEMLLKVVAAMQGEFQDIVQACIAVLEKTVKTVENDMTLSVASFFSMLLHRLCQGVMYPPSGTSTRTQLERQQSATQIREQLAEAISRYSDVEIECNHMVTQYVQQNGEHDDIFVVLTIITTMRLLALRMVDILTLCKSLPTDSNAKSLLYQLTCWGLWMPRHGLRTWFVGDTNVTGGIFIKRDPAEYKAAKPTTAQRALDDDTLAARLDAPETMERTDYAKSTSNATATAEHAPSGSPISHTERRVVPAHQTRSPAEERSNWHQRLLNHLYDVFDWVLLWCRSQSSKFAVKITLGAFIIALPAYVTFASGRFFIEVNGSWALVSALFMTNVAMGATVNFGIFRVLGAVFGALWAAMTIGIDTEIPNPYILCSFIMLNGLICWRALYAGRTYRFGTVSLIVSTTILTSVYNRSYNKPRALYDCLYRGSSTVVALLLTTFISSVFWPFSASRELRKLIGVIVGEIRTAYRLVRTFYLMDPSDPEFLAVYAQLDELGLILERDLNRAAELLSVARGEFYYRGFPAHTYDRTLEELREMCTWLACMRLTATQVDHRFVRHLHTFVHEEQAQFDAIVLLNLHVLSGALHARLPLPATLPSACAIRLQMLKRLCDAMRAVDHAEGIDISGSSHRHFGSDDTHRASTLHSSRYVYWYISMASLAGLIRSQERLVEHVRWLVGLGNTVRYK